MFLERQPSPRLPSLEQACLLPVQVGFTASTLPLPGASTEPQGLPEGGVQAGLCCRALLGWSRERVLVP